jgi:biotin operon repressor
LGPLAATSALSLGKGQSRDVTLRKTVELNLMTVARSKRLLVLLQTLRRYRQPVSGARLAAETGVSLRTLYRDIASLQAQGALIEGEAGLGYVLRRASCCRQ